VGLEWAFLEDPLLMGLLAAKSSKGMSLAIRKAAMKEGEEKAKQASAEGKTEEMARTLLGPRWTSDDPSRPSTIGSFVEDRFGPKGHQRRDQSSLLPHGPSSDGQAGTKDGVHGKFIVPSWARKPTAQGIGQLSSESRCFSGSGSMLDMQDQKFR
jgi:hypothetical protein